MKCEFSETTYAFSLISELIATKEFGKVVRAPFAPSTVDEGTKGFDVKLSTTGKPLFLQFKIPDYIIRKMSTSDSPLDSPFFRLKLWNIEISKQHYLLKKLSISYPGRVFYVAPAFYKLKELDDAFNNREISKNSAFFSLNNMPSINDNNDHNIYYKKSGMFYHANSYFCSDSHCISSNDGYSIRRYNNGNVEEVSIDSFCSNVIECVKDVLDMREDNFSYGDDSFANLQRILTRYGVILLFVK